MKQLFSIEFCYLVKTCLYACYRQNRVYSFRSVCGVFRKRHPIAKYNVNILIASIEPTEFKKLKTNRTYGIVLDKKSQN